MKKWKDLSPDEKKSWSQRLQLYGGLALIFVLCALFLRYYNVKLITSSGIEPTPRKTIAQMQVPYYAQDDARWQDDALGETGYTMAQEGSLFCCLATLLNQAGITVTPGELNQAFMDNEMYLDGTVANVTELSTLYPEVSFRAPVDFDGGTITDVLKKGMPCMVRVKLDENVHWLLVVGSNEDTFLVLDPAAGEEVHLLSEYGNVYALGIVE